MAIKGFSGETKNIEHYRDKKSGPVTKVVNTAKDEVKTFTQIHAVY